jgi:hypothetical protein
VFQVSGIVSVVPMLQDNFHVIYIIRESIQNSRYLFPSWKLALLCKTVLNTVQYVTNITGNSGIMIGVGNENTAGFFCMVTQYCGKGPSFSKILQRYM